MGADDKTVVTPEYLVRYACDDGHVQEDANDEICRDCGKDARRAVVMKEWIWGPARIYARRPKFVRWYRAEIS